MFLFQAIVVLLGFLIYLVVRKPKKNLPPGPKGLPIVGNVLDLPPKGTPDHEHWKAINDKYGPVASITVLGQNIIIVNDKDTVQEILEKKSLISSGRPILEFANYCGFGEFISLHQLSDRFRSQRRFLHQAIGTKNLAAKYADVQELEVGRMLLRALNEPEKVFDHFAVTTGAIILKIVYDYTVDPQKPDPLVGLIDRMMANFSRASVPFTRLVEFIPALKWLPEGFPCTGFKADAKKYNKEIQAVINQPYEFVRKQMTIHNRTESYVAKLVQGCIGDRDEPSPEDAYTIKWSAAALYGGGADTTVSTLISFIMAMIMFPEAQRRAQEEIDAVTGGTRLPLLTDRQQMPFVEAMVTEALRWCPILPMGVPHALSEDMTYKGYELPKGSYVFPAVWQFTHDPEVYAHPDAFTPERYLAPRHEPDPRWAVFGFGRRVCPGRYLADSSLFLSIANLVAAFDIGKATDALGNVLEPKLDFEAGIIAKPKAFPYKLVPRSEKYAELVKAVEREHPWEESDASQLGVLPPPSH